MTDQYELSKYNSWLRSLRMRDFYRVISTDRSYETDEEAYDSQYNSDQDFYPGNLLSDLYSSIGSNSAGICLEIGCGTGHLTAGLVKSSRFRRYLITDASQKFLCLTRHKLQASEVDLSETDFALFNGADVDEIGFHSFSLIALRSVLHHIVDYKHFFASLASKLKPGGIIALLEPRAEFFLLAAVILRSIAGASELTESEKEHFTGFHNTAKFYLDRQLDKSSAEDKYAFTTEELAALAAENGLIWHRMGAEYGQSYSDDILSYLRYCMSFPDNLIEKVRTPILTLADTVDELLKGVKTINASEWFFFQRPEKVTGVVRVLQIEYSKLQTENNQLQADNSQLQANNGKLQAEIKDRRHQLEEALQALRGAADTAADAARSVRNSRIVKLTRLVGSDLCLAANQAATASGLARERVKRLEKETKKAGRSADRASEGLPHSPEVVKAGKAHATEYVFENYEYRTGAGSSLLKGSGNILPLYEASQLDEVILELRGMLDRDSSPDYKAALDAPFANGIKQFSGHWFQRIDYPQHFISSTSDPSWAWQDEGGLNTLGQRLTSLEASLLRPWPKWLGYIKPLMPNLRGKTVLEIGSSNGFFSFRMAELGAATVTGIEIVPQQYQSACWSAGILGHRNIQFLNTDFLTDHRISPHDIIFLSEVQNHFLFPFTGLAKIINLARELVIFDTGAIDTPTQVLNLDTGWNAKSGGLSFHSFTGSDGLWMDYLALLGVPPNRVMRFKPPAKENHILYLIDTSHLSQDREKMQYPRYLWDSLQLGRDPTPVI